MTTAGSASTTILLQQLDAAASVILANGWSTESRIEKLKRNAGMLPPGSSKDGLTRFLVNHQCLTREQATELNSLQATQAFFPDFRLLKKLGSGGMGTVYLAEMAESRRRVAFKTISARLADDADFLSRFHRETKVLLGVRHPHIAEVIESGEVEGHVYLAMEHVDGPSLMTLLRQQRALPQIYVLRIVRQIAEGLGYVFSTAGLIHRDLKPENILVIRDTDAPADDPFLGHDTAKLIDFGLVKSNRDDDRLTQTGMTIGTPLYMSPEQIRGDKLDGRSDIYGLGATMYHLLTGSTPFIGTSPGAIMSAHLTDPVPDPGQLVPGLLKETREIVMTALAKAPKDRFLAAAAMAAACERAIAVWENTHGQAKSVRFLKKPLVLKQRPKMADKPAEAAKPLTARIMEKHQARTGQISPAIQEAVGAAPGALPAPQTSVAPRTTSSATRRAQGRTPLDVRAAASPPSPALTPKDEQNAKVVLDALAPSANPAVRPHKVEDSAAFRESGRSDSVGVGPLAFLGIAAVIVISVLIYVFFG